MTRFLDTTPSDSRVDTVFDANLGRWAEYRSHKERDTANATACNIRIMDGTERRSRRGRTPEAGRSIRGMGRRGQDQGGRR